MSGCARQREQQQQLCCSGLRLWDVCCTSATRKQPWLGLTLLPGAGPIAQPIRLMLLQTICRCYMEHLLLQSKSKLFAQNASEGMCCRKTEALRLIRAAKSRSTNEAEL